MAAVKPRKKATIVSGVAHAPTGVSGASSAKPFSGVPVTQPIAPAKPALAAVPKIAAGPPPATLTSTSDRNAANYSYGTMMGDTNSQLRSLAAQFGGAPQVTQYGYDPTGRKDTESTLDVAPNQPGSTMEVLLRNLGLTQGGINDTAESQNTFFGSRRVGDLGDADKQYQGDVATAKRTYDDAVSALTTALLTGRGTRNQNLTNADIADVQAAASTPPEAQAASPPNQPGYLDSSGFHSTILSPTTTGLINQWITSANKKKPKKK